MRRTKKGISFIEVIVALFLMNVIIFAIIGTILLFLKSVNKSIDRSRGVIVASSLMEKYLINNRMDLKDESGEEKYGNVVYYYKITTQKVSGTTPGAPEGYGSGLYQIEVTVSWKEWVIGGSETQSLKASRTAIFQGRRVPGT